MNDKIGEFISEKNIVLNLGALNQSDAIQKLATVLKKNGYIDDVLAFQNDVLEREKASTTGIGNELAIPHGKSTHVIQTTMMFARNEEGIEWNSLDGSKVKNIFLMAVSPEDKGNEHLKMLATLSGELMDDDFVEAIKKADSKENILKILQKRGNER
ncbi:PTS sugar transporter subunit IIA [Liquorilactobacillus mali]|uniref:PTS system mannose-specific transporter subunit IIBCA n=1 Tax=Liquorilactobacillus mali KCTC 3596 = DSM 20444 TaxID=1046596 RepID=J1F4A8_9LACO|nr:fructose PTS transporter subunit IIA [Liquorilactobacillus mali]EJF00652.1 PTS system mannose-specific transporter subunit IIBCA [Liquorilactobacillus mali KCTC 3596 = DSM 20444]KRN10156.1 PTS system mannose-specific transporter subunit IIBCA [Liquorilactobacillus mali KCTC 3596 = DSM 20444]MDC7953028.1 fructose PTS transporter subunit IIA [Liquorilactobacillus mali]MDV7757895.1 PTS mannose transporter subunit IIAB [Liquorilactobacillus mali]QFQ74031.1 PTS mannose transporter subunit IIAB [